MTNDPYNLAEHMGAILILLNLVIMVAGALFWHMVTRMEKKIDAWLEVHAACQKENMKISDFKYWLQTEWKEWKEGRTDLWNRINKHQHGLDGKVQIHD